MFKASIILLLCLCVSNFILAQEDPHDDEQAAIVVNGIDEIVNPTQSMSKLMAMTSVGIYESAIKNFFSISLDELPEAVIQTLESRYFSRGYSGHNCQTIEGDNGERYFSIDLERPDTSLFVMLDEAGRVFKAELQ